MSHRDYKAGPFTSPRHWITLKQEIIGDFPGPCLKWVRPDVPKPLAFLEEDYWLRDGSKMSDLLRAYLATPVSALVTRTFPQDHWHFTNILRAADRRVGQRRLGL